MEPTELGLKYDKIAQWWHNQHDQSAYGVPQLKLALGFASAGGSALDIGCGAGGRLIRLMEGKGFSVTGLDISKEMINLAKINHPQHLFMHQDICQWQTKKHYNFILAWDSLFHLPLAMQKPVLRKISNLLTDNGVLIYSFGNAVGEHTDQWHEDTFYYSSIGINENLSVLMQMGLTIMHVEQDQLPEKHVFVIASKL